MIEEERSYEENLKRNIESIKEIYKNEFALETNYNELENIVEQINKNIYNIDESKQNKIEENFKQELKDLNEKCELYILSFLVKLYKKSEYLNRMFEIVINSKELNKDTKYFVFGQLNYIISTFKESLDERTIKLQSKLYENILEEFNKEMTNYSFIPKEERKEDFIIIFTSQILGMRHGPTQTALDICYSLIKYLNKKVMLINTDDLLTNKGIIPIHNTVVANTNDNIKHISYKNTSIPFYRTKNEMPNVKEYINIANVVKKYKPYLLFSIGDKCIISDICKQIVPTCAICLSDAMPLTNSDFIIPFAELLYELKDKIIIKRIYENGVVNDSKYLADAYKEIISSALFK